MKALLQNAHYVYDSASKIWSRSSYSSIDYSDGDEVETRISGIIDAAQDVTVLSAELRRSCTDWASLYHLAGTRANILRPLNDLLKGEILEVGAGCGAITRYLGETGASVLALEGSKRRAGIARSRTRDLNNVEVVAERFDDFDVQHGFDVVTLIGVLEYANWFTPGADPALAMLSRIKQLLKPGGVLIVAIENQLGLKYFAGAPEDHLGIPMYGIEGRYDERGPETFGRKTINSKLLKAGFATPEFLLPFPDYKFPASIVTATGLKNTQFDAGAFAWQSARRDPQLPIRTNFSLELAWPQIFRNELATDLANSFLIVASPSPITLPTRQVLAYHYSTDRAPDYCKETKFIEETGTSHGIVVEYSSLTPKRNAAKPTSIDDQISFTCPAKVPYSNGRPLSFEFLNVVSKDEWSMEHVGGFLKKYISALTELALPRTWAQPIELHQRLPGDCFDLVPQNIVVNTEQRFEIIDREWTLNIPLELGYLLFRSLMLMLGSITRFGQASGGVTYTRRSFVHGAFNQLGLSPTDLDLHRYSIQEARLQEMISGLPAQRFLDWLPDMLLPTETIEQAIVLRDAEIQRLNASVKEVSDWAKTFDGPLLQRQLVEKQKELMRMSDWADGMRRQLERRNRTMLRRAVRRLKALEPSVRANLSRSWLGTLVRYVRNKQQIKNSRGKVDAVRDSVSTNEGRLIITFPIITWDFRWQRPQHIVTRLRDRGYAVLYIAMSMTPLGRKLQGRNEAHALLGFNTLDDHVHQTWLHSAKLVNVYTDPIEGDDLHNAYSGLEATIEEVKPTEVLYLLQFPGWWPIAKLLKKKFGGRIIFDCMDDHAGFSTNSTAALQTEEDLVRYADLVIASSDTLETKMRRFNSNTVQVKNGTEFDHFNKARRNGLLDHLGPNPIIGYYGAISDWFDMDIVAHCATKHPEWTFVLIGSTYGADLSKINRLTNVHLLGEKKYAELPGYLAYFDVCTIPFKIIPLTLATNPVKFYEYLSAGKPVVSVALLELLPYDAVCYLAHGTEEFEQLIHQALDERNDEEKIKARLELAKANSWDSRVRSICEALEKSKC